jgi:hypothetical protein
MGTFRSSNSTKHHGKRFKSHTYVHTSKIKDKQRVKQEKASQETQNLKDSFYLIFFDANTKLRHFKLAKILKHTQTQTKDS